ncbi:DUF3987 domain-containing protein [Streptomyces sp. CFMR 7]|uniref:DUF3987 domain-containing protein n=1 Tax=Streptomyces sp. CFMR 7 TaxID=1649184 RepID=UPI0011A969B9|nr:DUF3987 domain-containing protein [Streptomyces sp. CFMR 7]
MKVLTNRLDRFEKMTYGPLGKAVREAMPHTEADPIGVLGAAYALLSAAFNGRVLQPGSARPVVVWTVLVGRSTIGGKGRALRTASTILESGIGAWQSTHTKKSIKNAPTLIRVMTQAIEESRSTEAGEDGRILMLCEEWGSTLKTLNRDAQFSEHLRMAWDGVPISNTIKGKKAGEAEEEWIERPLLGFHGHIQPGVWPTVVKQSNALGGDYNRMLPVAVEEWQELDDPNVDHDSLITSNKALADAYEWVRKGSPKEMRFSDSAAREFIDARNTHKAYVREMNEQITCYFERAPENIARIACLLTAAAKQTTIQVGAVKAARAFVEYSRDTVIELAMTPAPTTHSNAPKTLEQKIRDAFARNDGRLTRSQLLFAIGGRHVVAEVEAVIAQLPDVSRTVVPNGRPGPNPVVFELLEAPKEPVQAVSEAAPTIGRQRAAKKAVPVKREAPVKATPARKVAAKKTVKKAATGKTVAKKATAKKAVAPQASGPKASAVTNG